MQARLQPLAALFPRSPGVVVSKWPQDLDLAAMLEPGDTIVWTHGAAEPVNVVRQLLEQRSALPPDVTVFLTGISYSGMLEAVHADHLRFSGIGGLGSLSVLSRGGALDVVPCRFGELPRLIRSGDVRADVFVTMSTMPGAANDLRCGPGVDVTPDFLATARTVVAQVNPHAPWVDGDVCVPSERVDVVVYGDHPLVEAPAERVRQVHESVAREVARHVPNCATLQVGIGGVGQALPRFLADHKHLGIHSGILTDALWHLVESGVVDGSQKETDTGLVVAGSLLGSRRLYASVNGRDDVRLRASSYVLAPGTLSEFDRLVSVNGAVEVDLTGQVNAEVVGGVHVGAVGGQVDFVRGAARSAHGRSIIALPSTGRHGVSRIVASLDSGVVTTARSDVDLVVTEYGTAELAGATLTERAKRLIAVAHPDHRDELRRHLDHLC